MYGPTKMANKLRDWIADHRDLLGSEIIERFDGLIDGVEALYNLEDKDLKEGIKALQVRLWGKNAKTHSEDTPPYYWVYERQDLISEIERALADQIVILAKDEMLALQKKGWFSETDIEENDGMLSLKGQVTQKFNRLTNSSLSLFETITFWAEDGQLWPSEGQLGKQAKAFVRLIDLAETYYTLSYGNY